VVCLGLWPERGLGKRGRVYPCGWQVGQGSPLGSDTRLVSGEEGRERLDGILQDLGLAWLGSPLPPPFPSNFEQGKAEVVLGEMLGID
jgi:hypothetical protein